MLSGRKDRRELLETLRIKKNNSVHSIIILCNNTLCVSCWKEPPKFLSAPVT